MAGFLGWRRLPSFPTRRQPHKMARAYLTYDLGDSEDSHQFELANAAEQMAMVLNEYDQYLRGELIYGDHVEAAHEALTRAREELHEQLAFAGLDLNNLAR